MGWCKISFGWLSLIRSTNSFQNNFRICNSTCLRLSSIWQNIQELKISFERLADVIDTPQESDETDKDKIPLAEIKEK